MDFLSNHSDIYTTKVRIMRKIITLFAFILTALCSSAQEWWEAVKVFDFDPEDKVYNMYIDSVGGADGSAMFCFQTDSTNRLIKTDLYGEILQISDNPYRAFTVFNGDTLVPTRDAIINLKSGDSLYIAPYDHICSSEITSSSSAVYVVVMIPYRVANRFVIIDCIKGKHICSTIGPKGICCSEEGVYFMTDGFITYVDVNGENKVQTAYLVKDPAGITHYKGSLYVYSNTDKAVYRLNITNETGIYPVISSDVDSEPVHYGLDGKMIDPSTPGIHIARYPDGSVKKIVQ